jgi:Ca2+/Na+ antiporter
MWKVEFRKFKNTITLYVADDALLYPYTEMNAEDLKQYFEDQLGKLAFVLERSLHSNPEKQYESTVYIRSCIAKNAKISGLDCHYQATVNNQMQKPTIGYYALDGAGKNYTNDTQPANITQETNPIVERIFANFDQVILLARLGNHAPIANGKLPFRRLEDLEHSDRTLTNYIKTNVTIALYNSALEYYRYIWDNYRKDLKSLNEQIEIFNKKFAGIANINSNFSITPLENALEHMKPLPLKSQEGENFEDKVNNLLLHAADVVGDALVQKYGPEFEFIKNNLNQINDQCRITIDDNILCQPFFEPVSKPTDNNVGIVTDHLPVVRSAVSVLAMGTKMLLENTIKNKRREFVLNPWVFDLSKIEKLSPPKMNASGNNNNIVTRPNAEHDQSHVARSEIVMLEDNIDAPAAKDSEDKSITELLRELDETDEAPIPAPTSQKIRLFSSIAVKRLIIGAVIGFCIAAVAATIISLTLFSGGTIVPPLVAAGMVLAIGGTGPAIAAIIGGALLTTAIGAGIAALFNYRSTKRNVNNVISIPNPEGSRVTHVKPRSISADESSRDAFFEKNASPYAQQTQASKSSQHRINK